MFFFDTLVIDKAKQYQLDPFFWTLIPLTYMLFALLNGLVLKWPIPGAKIVPCYFFINVNKYGWANRQMGGDRFITLTSQLAMYMGSKISETEHYSDEKSCFKFFEKVEFFLHH